MLLAVTALMLVLAQPGWTHGGQALSKETLKKLFPEADNFVTKPLGLTAAQRKSIEGKIGAKLEEHDLKAPAYIASSKGRSIGIVWATDAHLKKGNVDVIVGVNLKGNVTGVVLDHSKVAGLDKPAYLGQYKKLTTGSSFQEGKDLKPLAGQEPSSKMVAAAVKKSVAIIDESFLAKK
jgi:hypothetical protein